MRLKLVYWYNTALAIAYNSSLMFCASSYILFDIVYDRNIRDTVEDNKMILKYKKLIIANESLISVFLLVGVYCII